MKSKIVFYLLTGVLLFSCKTTPTPSVSVDYFIFGSAHCHCLNHCATLYKYTPAMLVKGAGESCQPADYTYNGRTLGAGAIAKAEKLLLAVPAELYAAQDTVFGCPDCADQGTFYVEVKKDGAVMSWRIDTNESDLPAFLKPFHQKIKETLEALRE